MNNSTEIKTPNNKIRCLGLRRSSHKNSITRKPASDTKVTYQTQQTPNATEVTASPITPRLTGTPGTSSLNTKSCLPYRLSLSRGVREKYKKKKLEFAINQLEEDSKTPPNIQQEIADKEKLLERHNKHKAKVKELKNVIAIWTEAFKLSLEELSSKTEPKMEAEDLIARLGIPPDMINLT